ncbi:uncharacterized protein LOC18429277 isoform X2 [Amborella trichopoda]|uniref:uncharacterized protein LOC18429277 isoform X2 n=1 Tax=Amborella trichopoda TaxID=13333 RepID=UPI0005D353D1|nr:uncharacterized protein LOC18429277 isoform X2 [Amborella trichopoda]|eukprot:XP_011621536.1 uncharacterized protein LOC18429277 isoform X2 [Amborella trichopoda]
MLTSVVISWGTLRIPNLLVSLSSSSPTTRNCFLAFPRCFSSRPFTNSRPTLKLNSDDESPKEGILESGLYLVATPIGNLEDITLRALRVLKTADVILAEDTRHSGKLLQHYNIRTHLLSYHKFNESQREATILQRLQQGGVIALISDAGTPGISDPGAELAKMCASKNIAVFPVPGPSALIAALSASGLSTNEFTFVGFLPKHAGSRRKRLIASADETATQIFYVPPHSFHQCLEEMASIFTDSRSCVVARELTKVHEEFWRGTLGEAKDAFSSRQLKGEITLLIQGQSSLASDNKSEAEIEHELRELVSNGQSLSMAVKLVSQGSSVKRKAVYALALRIFGEKL